MGTAATRCLHCQGEFCLTVTSAAAVHAAAETTGGMESTAAVADRGGMGGEPAADADMNAADDRPATTDISMIMAPVVVMPADHHEAVSRIPGVVVIRGIGCISVVVVIRNIRGLRHVGIVIGRGRLNVTLGLRCVIPALVRICRRGRGLCRRLTRFVNVRHRRRFRAIACQQTLGQR